jgi:branched-chain amino acid transport system permease protein
VIPGESLAIWVLPIMLVVGMVAAVGVSLLTERFAYRPLRNAPRLAPLITAIGVSVFLQEFVRLFYGRIPGFPDARRAIPFPQIEYVTGPAIQLGPITIQRAALFTMIALVICWAFLYVFVNRTQMGRAMQATSQDPDTSRLMGINVDRIIMVAFALGAALAAVAGLAWGLRYTNIDFRMGFIAGLKAFTAAVLGGIGNINGAVVGGLVLGLVEGMATLIPGTFGGSAWKDVWAFVLLILVLVFRPQGLLGARVVDRA